jgi:hypothetical protein
MRLFFTGLILVALGPGLAGAQRLDQLVPAVRSFVSVEGPTTVLANVTVVDGTGAPARSGQSVVLADG